jgi:hypothetical protein
MELKMKRLILLISVLLCAQLAQAQISSPARVVYRPSLPATCTPGTSPMVRLTLAPYSLNNCTATNTWSLITAGAQPLDSDLTAIAALSPSNDDVIQRKAGTWTNRSMAQLKTDLALTKSDVGLSNVDNTADTAKPVSTAQQTALNLKANLSGGNTFAGIQSFGSVLRAPDGNITTPAYSFTNSTSIGMYQASNIINIRGASGSSSINLGSTSGNVLVIGDQVVNTGSAATSIGGNGIWTNQQYASSIAGQNPDIAWARAKAGVWNVSNPATSTGGTIRAIALSPAQVTADQNDYAPSGSSMFIRLTSDASRNLTGLSISQVDGEIHYIWNVGSQNIVLVNESASSTAANRFTTTTGADLTVAANKCAMLMYDGTSARWRVVLLP